MLIALTGKARSGKDTVGHYLAAHYGYTCLAFADALKDQTYALAPYLDGTTRLSEVSADHPERATIVKELGEEAALAWDPFVDGTTRLNDVVDKVGWESAKTSFPEVRPLLQRLGTEAGWMIHGRDHWIRPVAEKVRESDGRVVITDARFPAEVEWVRSQGGAVVGVVRPDNVHALTGEEAEHASEAYNAEDADDIIDNDSTIEALHAEVRALLSRLNDR